MACVAAASATVPCREVAVVTSENGVTHAGTLCNDADGERRVHATCKFRWLWAIKSWVAAWGAVALPAEEQDGPSGVGPGDSPSIVPLDPSRS